MNIKSLSRATGNLKGRKKNISNGDGGNKS
jgi:hypothetical protein